MRKLIITLDEDLDPWLAKFSNQAEIVRKALRLYKGDISTDTIEGLREAFKTIDSKLDTLLQGRAETTDDINSISLPQENLGLERGCCKLQKPCQHWQWNDEEWVNSLSGRKRDGHS